MFDFLSGILYFLFISSPIFIVLFIGAITWYTWLEYTKAKFRAKNKRILLEIKVPQNIEKSPLAMELALMGMYITGREGTFFDRNIKGKSRPYFSLEITSFAGEIHFYIWTEMDLKDMIESQIYAQYPNVEILEVSDYTKDIVFDPTKNNVWGAEFIKTASDVIPIKTYIDYGMDKDQEEEYRIDPITATLELLGSLKADQQIWIQFIIRAHKKERTVIDKKTGKKKKVDWTHFAEEEKKKILDKLKGDEKTPARRATKGEEAVISAIERNVSKLAFDTGIRVVYFAQKDAYKQIVASGLNGVFKQYNAFNLNSFKPNNATSFDYPWQDFRDMRLNKRRIKMLNYYKKRKFFGVSGRGVFAMSIEELATMYHFPGSSVTTPTFSRIMSKKSEPPANLPI